MIEIALVFVVFGGAAIAFFWNWMEP